MLHHLAAYAPIAAAALYVVLFVGAAWRGLRKEPRAALVAAGLAVLAVAIRFLVAPRVPMIAQNADFEHLTGALGWWQNAPTWGPGAYPPGGSALLYLVFSVFGASFEVAFATTTVLGGLTVWPVFSLARRLGGSLVAGLLAGLALATMPLAVVFANGLNLEVPTAFFLVATLAHALAFVDDERSSDALRTGLAFLLFVQMRPEAVLQAPPVLAGLLVLPFAAAKAGRLASRPGLWGAVALAALLGAPFLGLAMGAIPAQRADDVERALRLSLAFAPAVLLVGLLGARGLDGLRAAKPAWWTAVVALAALGLARVGVVLARDGLTALAPAWKAASSLPTPWPAATGQALSYGAAHMLAVDNPWFFPVTWLVPLPLALLAARRASASRAASASVVVLGALCASWLAMVAASLPSSGELIGDGVRYRVPVAGLLAVLVGVGAAAVLASERLTGRFRVLAVVPLVAWMLSPLATHRGVLTDVAFDQQARYGLLRPALASLPERTLLLAPDHLIYADVPDAPDGGRAWWSSRTPALCQAARTLLGRPEACLGLREWAVGGRAWEGPVVLLLDLDCFRTRHGTEDTLCAELRRWPGLHRLADLRLANRPYSRYPLSNAATVEVGLYEVPSDLVGDVKRRILDDGAVRAP